MAAAADCSVCCLQFTPQSRKKISCAKCDFKACASCYKQWLSQPGDDANAPPPLRVGCMSCKQPFTTMFVAKSFDLTFRRKKLAPRVATALEHMERAQMEATQNHIEGQNRRLALQKEIRECRRRVQKLNQELAQEMLGKPSAEVSRDNTGRKCPREDCAAFLKRSGHFHACPSCSFKQCTQCRDVLPAGQEPDAHQCDPDTLANAQAIINDPRTRPCPDCNMAIYKTEGCDQMFCTQCKVLFSWNTGKVDRSGLAHNPYWYEWQAELGRRGGAQVPGQGCMDLRTAQLTLTRLTINRREAPAINAAIQCVGHFNRTQLEPSRQAARNTSPTDFNTNLQWRWDLLENRLSRENFNRRLLIRYSRHNREQAKMEVMEAFYHMALDVLRAMATQAKSLANGLAELHQLRGIMNDAMGEISDFLRCQVPLISDTWQVFFKRPAVKSRPKKPKPPPAPAAGAGETAADDVYDDDEIDELLKGALDGFDSDASLVPAAKVQRTQ